MSHPLSFDDDQRFEQYMDALAEAIGHQHRAERLRGYCTGLLLPGARKSIEPIAARLAPDRARIMHQNLHHFIADGAWSDAAVLAAVRAQVLPSLVKHGPIRFSIVDDTGMPKKGTHSVGVARQYCGELGKVDNCQVLVSLSVANDAACLPVAARLYLPEAWAEDVERRGTVGVPLDVSFLTKPAIALEQIRHAHASGVPLGVVLADEAYGANPPFRRGVAALGLAYALGVPSSLRVYPPRDGRRARCWPDQDGNRSVRDLAGRLPRSRWRWITWRDGTGRDLTSRFARIRVRVAPTSNGTGKDEGEQTLLIEWPVGEPDPLGYWLVTLPSHTALEAVVNTAKGRWWIEQGYRDLKQEVGLGDFEGRGWRGFHHHVTLTLAAYGFLVMQRCEHGPPAGGRATNLSFPGVPDPANPPLRPERHVASSIATQRRRVIIVLARRLPRCPCCHALPTPQFDRANPIRLVPQ
jgi:SRSO17 transposase